MATHSTIALPSGNVLVIEMQSYPDLVTGRHAHSCPTCYEHVACEDRCSVELDLTLDDGTLRGAYLECDACADAKGQSR
jgi:hypothetical protein